MIQSANADCIILFNYFGIFDLYEEIAKLEEFYNFLHFEPLRILFRAISYSSESGSIHLLEALW